MANDISTQTVIQREAPEVEAYKLGLLQEARRLYDPMMSLPAVEAAGLSPAEQQAMDLARQGIGAFEPYVQAGAQGLTQGMDLTQRGALAAGAVQTAPMYQEAQNVLGRAVPVLGQGIGGLLGSAQAYDPNRRTARTFRSLAEQQADPTVRQLNSISQQLSGMDPQSPEAQALRTQFTTLEQGMYQSPAESFMNPYQQAVTQEALREIGRQGQIQQQNLSSQAVRAGAFGGSREGVQRAEQNRNILDLMSKRIAEDYSQNFLQAQQASMNAFQNQQARAQQAGNLALGAAQSVGQTGIQAGGLQQQAGTSTAALGQQLSGLQQGDVSFLYNMGTNLQGQQQRVLDAARQTQLQQSYEPYQRISFLSDIYKGAPSSQQTLAQTTAPSPSMASQVGGLGIAALGAYNLFGKQG